VKFAAALPIGLAIGAAIGAALGDMPRWLATGAIFGLVFTIAGAVAFNRGRNRCAVRPRIRD